MFWWVGDNTPNWFMVRVTILNFSREKNGGSIKIKIIVLYQCFSV